MPLQALYRWYVGGIDRLADGIAVEGVVFPSVFNLFSNFPALEDPPRGYGGFSG